MDSARTIGYHAGSEMKLLDALASRLPAPRLTKGRVFAAFIVAASCDAFQIFLGPLGWWAPDEVLDCIAFVLITWLIGFHVLLLPTFAIEFIPGIGMLPTWTGCVTAVIALRRRASGGSSSVSSMTPQPPVMRLPPLLTDTPERRPPTRPAPDPEDANPS